MINIQQSESIAKLFERSIYMIKSYVVTSEEMKRYDSNTIERFGVPSLLLMEQAAMVTVEEIKKRFSNKQSILILAGTGNNGGDGLAVGRLLMQLGYSVCFSLFCSKEEAEIKCSKVTLKQVEILENYGVVIENSFEHNPKTCYDVIVDALIGIGLKREITGRMKELITWVNQSSSSVISLDIPTGIHTDSGQVLGVAVKADYTVTFSFLKRGHCFYPGVEFSGEISCRQIGITEHSFLSQEPQMYTCLDSASKLLPPRRQDGHKGTFGKVLLVAGSLNMSGACELAGRSIYRVGAGMVKIVTAKENRIILQSTIPEALFAAYDTNDNAIEEAMDWADVILVGPGLGQSQMAKTTLLQIITGEKKPLVIDADALNLLATNKELYETLSLLQNHPDTKRDLILTPHLLEFARICQVPLALVKDDTLKWIQKIATDLQATVVCKDAKTIVGNYEKQDYYLNTNGNNGMATAGSGDVLAGIITGLLAQGMNSYDAACVGTYLHGWAGDRALTNTNSYFLMAHDIIDQLAFVLEK